MGQQPWIAADKNGVYAVWLEKRDGKLLLAGIAGDLPTELARAAQYPVVAASPNGQGPVIVAWEAEEQGQHVIKTLARAPRNERSSIRMTRAHARLLLGHYLAT